MQKKVSCIVYIVLVVLCAAALIYLAVFNQKKTEVVITTTPVAEIVEKEPKVQVGNAEDPIGVVNINTADRYMIETLPEIGPELAERIVAYRESVGKFVCKEQIMDVEGIGEKRYAQIEQFITVGGTP